MFCKFLYSIIFIVIQLFYYSDGFSTYSCFQRYNTLLESYKITNEYIENDDNNHRRKVLAFIPILLLSTSTLHFFPSNANAVTMEQPKEKIFKVGEALGVDGSKARFLEAKKTLDYLIKNFDIISKDGGDNIRRYLGTVGTTSALYGITKVMRELQEEANDIVEFTENMNDFEYWLRAADTAAYSANFVEFSAAKTKPEEFYQDAKNASIRMKGFMDAMSSEINF